MHQLDAAFFMVGEARGAMLLKYYPLESEMSVDELRELTKCIEKSRLVKDERAGDGLDGWPGTHLRRAQILHMGTIWFSDEACLALSRVTLHSSKIQAQ
jgi:hypothetical protein